jgi:cysteine-rich repeat protein
MLRSTMHGSTFRPLFLVASVGAACLAPDEVIEGGDSTSSTGGAVGTGPSEGSDAGGSGAVDDSTGAPEPICGNGVVEGDEACDEGDANAFDGECVVDCTVARCGDGFVQTGVEQCDDGNTDDADGCTNDCIDVALCGDGRINNQEECDNGAANADNAGCLSDCRAAACGDGLVHSGVEDCDDGNDNSDDQCTVLCAVPICGDGFVQSVLAEGCDDGDAAEGDECNGDCQTWGLWTHEFNGSDDLNDEVFDVAFDGADDLVVVGSTFDIVQGADVWLRKLAADGSTVWTQTYHDLTTDIGYSVAIGNGDDIFVAGTTITQNDGRDIWLRRYSSGGTGGFIRTANGSDNSTDEAHGVAVDSAGNVIVAGFVTTPTQGRNIWVRKYSSTGTTLWTRTATGAGSNTDEANGVATDGTDVIVTGFTWVGADERDVWVRRYDSNGNEQWTHTYDEAGASDEGNDVTVDAAGDIIVVGTVETAGQGRDIWIRKLDSAGNELWTTTYNAPQNGTDEGHAVAVNAADEVFVAGSIFRGMLSDNIFLGKFSAAGVEQWTVEHNSDGWLSDVGHGVAVDGSGDVAVGGYETRSDIGQAHDAWVRFVVQ